MTAPISNEPTTTRLHHYAGHYSSPARKGDGGFRQPGHLADRARPRRLRSAVGPVRGARGQYPLQTSSNQRDSNRLARTSVTNVVNLRPKTLIFSEKAVELTTFVTTRTRAPQKLSARGPRDAHSKQQDLAKQQPNAPSNINDQAPLVWRAPEG